MSSQATHLGHDRDLPRGKGFPLGLTLFGALLLGWTAPVFAQGAGGSIPDYRTLFNWDSRTIIWIVAQLHLMFGAFVLGVPMFAIAMEIVGWRSGDKRYDDLAHEFTKLLAAAFTTTASLGALMTFLFYGLYPKFMGYMTNVFSGSFYFYGLLFFAEAFTLYYYYYSWDRLATKKGRHIFFGILLNVFGVLIVLVANSWTSFMMSPSAVDAETMDFTGTMWQAIKNPLWRPLNIHRLIANVTFGGFVAGAYAAVKFLGARTPAERAHYDWMGYVGNLVGVLALIPLPFAGYYLGREIYSFSAVMGNNMMGGTFSWTFIIQAMLIGMIFIGANFYMWAGMQRIPGGSRYLPFTKFLNVLLIVSFAVWLTPHNLPLSSQEQVVIGGQYHPVLKYFGLMSAKNAVANLIILSTFFSFLLYRRGNRGEPIPFGEQGARAKVTLSVMSALMIALLVWYAAHLFTLDPATMDLSPDRRPYFLVPAYLMIIQMGAIGAAVALTFANRGKAGQYLLFLVTAGIVVIFLGIYGYVIMERANPFLRNIAVVQVLLVVTCIIVNLVVDIFLYRNAPVVGLIRWGEIPPRSQYALILLCVSIVMLMGLMGYIRSGLREDWHIYGVMRDTSAGAFTPTMAYMSQVVGIITLVFLGLMTFVFWLSGQAEKVRKELVPGVAPRVSEQPGGGGGAGS